MNKPNYRRKRRGVYIHPLFKLLAVLLAAGVFAGIYMRRRSPEENPSSSPSAPEQGGAKALSAQMTTPSGIPCTLTQLGANAVYTGDLVLVNNWTPFHFPDNQEEELQCILEERTGSY